MTEGWLWYKIILWGYGGGGKWFFQTKKKKIMRMKLRFFSFLVVFFFLSLVNIRQYIFCEVSLSQKDYSPYKKDGVEKAILNLKVEFILMSSPNTCTLSTCTGQICLVLGQRSTSPKSFWECWPPALSSPTPLPSVVLTS